METIDAHDYRSYGQSLVVAQIDVITKMHVATRRWFEIGGSDQNQRGRLIDFFLC